MVRISCLLLWYLFVKNMVLRFMTSMIVIQQQDLGVLVLKRIRSQESIILELNIFFLLQLTYNYKS